MGNDITKGLYENEKALFKLFTSTNERTEKEKKSFVENIILGRELAEKDPLLRKLRKQKGTERGQTNEV